MTSKSYQRWIQNQLPRRFYARFPAGVSLQQPLLGPEMFSGQQLEDGFVGWWLEYPLDADRTGWRVSPIFGAADAAVSWLTRASASWRSPFAGSVHMYAPEYGSPDQHDGQVVFELADRYGGHAFADDLGASPLSTVIFRGQANAKHGLIPRLYRCFRDPSLGWWAARRRFKSERRTADKFVNEFFARRETLSRLPELGALGGPTRAAVARHYGYHSQFIDFTADVGVAGCFATWDPTPSKIGSIWYLDEAYLERGMSGKAIMRTPRFEHRMLFESDVAEFSGRLIDQEPGGNFNWAGPAPAWEVAREYRPVPAFSSKWIPWVIGVPVQFSISMYFAPGPRVPRMHAQAWCAVEINSHLGYDKGSARRFTALHEVLERLAGRVNFMQGGTKYTRPARTGAGVPRIFWHEVSERAIIPPVDAIEHEIALYQQGVRRRPS